MNTTAKVDDCIRIHPAHDLFMQGAKYAVVRKVIRDVNGKAIAYKVRPYVGGVAQVGRLRLVCVDLTLSDDGK